MSDAADRRAILARRSFLVSSALAGLHCSTGLTGANAPVPLVWKEHLAKAPPRLDTTAFPEIAALALSDWVTWLDRAYAALEKLFEPAGEEACAEKAACTELWTARSERLEDARAAQSLRGYVGCGDDELPKSLDDFLMAHERFLEASLKLATTYWTELAHSIGPAALEAWRSHSPAAPDPFQPCLSCLPPERVSLPARFTFSEGSAALDRDAELVVNEVLEALKDPSMRLELWGHALTSEQDPTTLARLRAEAALAALTARGVDPARVTIVPLGVGFAERGLVEVMRLDPRRRRTGDDLGR